MTEEMINDNNPDKDKDNNEPTEATEPTEVRGREFRPSILLRLMMFFPTAILITLIIISVMAFNSSVWRGIISLIPISIFLGISPRNIPNRPPYVGIVVVLGKRFPIVKREGWHLFLSILYSVEMICVEKVNLDFTFEDIRCRAGVEGEMNGIPRAGGEVSVNISLTYHPDYKSKYAGYRLISFLNSGEHQKVESIIRDLLEEDVRHMARDNTWEEVTFSTEEIKSKLVRKLTGEDLTEEVAEELNKNGLPDIADLGVKITRFNVGRVKEQGALAEAAGKFAKEIQERRGDMVELQAVHDMLEKLKKSGVPVNEALDAIQAERGKAQKKIVAIRGVDQAATTLGAGLVAIGDAIGKGKVKKDEN